MAQNLAQLTDQWMVDPTMFDPTQRSNQFSLYNNQRLPYPPTYNGVPTNAMGQPIQSFQNWQAQNPGGTTLNATPAMPPQAPQATYYYGNALSPGGIQTTNTFGPQVLMGAPGVSRAQGLQNMQTANNAVLGLGPGGSQFGAGATQPQQPQAPQASGPPNNWQAAINALANPGNPAIQGANVPLQTGSQPAGGVNQAFLQNAGAGQGMNQGFLSALRAIQGRGQ